MDGTLVDSEGLTERAVDLVLTELSVPHDELDSRPFLGVTWRAIEAHLVGAYPQLAGEPLGTLLGQRFEQLFCDELPPFVEQAPAFLARARRFVPTAIATSSDASCLEVLMARLTPDERPRAWVSAEDCERSKPDPECFLKAAAKLAVEPARCLVFEDSVAGLRAARAAGMRAVAITQCAPNPEATALLADLAVRHYGELPGDFLENIAGDRVPCATP